MDDHPNAKDFANKREHDAARLDELAETYVQDLFTHEYPWALDEDGDRGIVEFTDTSLAEAFLAGYAAARSALR